ncbi:hypothetical protein FD754_016191 [Muntiacus muntjak]|uniref:Uncharacterized protein n=1 Tax=Muntiacus muntjak TaxID=9888 RepID=A0A5N3VQC3_MUNMU|nr:hypothetical protein FD754_016191 [Muntiacus muntjak]
MQPAACAGSPKGPWRQLFLVGIHDWPAVSQSRLQTGMHGAFGKPQGTVARVHIGQVIMSIRTKLQNKEHVIEALCWAKFKFSGHQKIHISKKWGFTKFNENEFENMVAEKRLILDGFPSLITLTNKCYFLSKKKKISYSNTVILKEINPEYSLEGLMLKLQYFGRLM